MQQIICDKPLGQSPYIYPPLPNDEPLLSSIKGYKFKVTFLSRWWLI